MLPALLAGCVLTACGADPSGDQAATRPAAEAPHPDRLTVPGSGWFARTDEGEECPPATMTAEERALELKYAPSAALWQGGWEGLGNYEFSATVTHLDSGIHPHGAGLAFGGTDVAAEQQRYTYFMVRSDQMFLIKTRDGTETSDVVPWTDHASIAKEDADLHMTNRLAVQVRGAEVRFLINGVEVHRDDSGELPARGLYGFRIVHDIHVRFEGMQMLPLD